MVFIGSDEPKVNPNLSGGDAKKQISILVVSCDRYADVWPAFFALFWKYWPDCPYPVYLGANRLTYPDKRVTMVLTGNDPSWAESTRRMVEQVPSEHILLLLEDFFFQGSVDTRKIARLFAAFQTLDGAYLRLRPRLSKPDVSVNGFPEIGYIEPGAPYRVALQAAFWKKSALLVLLHDGESAWDMELKGSRRSDNFTDKFYSTWESALDYFSAITRGMWTRQAYHFCLKEGIEFDLRQRPLMARYQDIKLRFGRVRTRILTSLPWKWRLKMKRVVNRTSGEG